MDPGVLTRNANEHVSRNALSSASCAPGGILRLKYYLSGGLVPKAPKNPDTHSWFKVARCRLFNVLYPPPQVFPETFLVQKRRLGFDVLERLSVTGLGFGDMASGK